MIPFFGLKGFIEARQKKIQAHRASMIMFSSCFFYFGVQRLVMIAFTPLHTGWLAKYMPLGPWKDWGMDDYEIFFPSAIALAGVPSFGIAIYSAYIAPAQAKLKSS